MFNKSNFYDNNFRLLRTSIIIKTFFKLLSKHNFLVPLQIILVPLAGLVPAVEKCCFERPPRIKKIIAESLTVGTMSERVPVPRKKYFKFSLTTWSQFKQITILRAKKTGLQPVSRPVERTLGFLQKGFNAKMFKKLELYVKKVTLGVTLGKYGGSWWGQGFFWYFKVWYFQGQPRHSINLNSFQIDPMVPDQSKVRNDPKSAKIKQDLIEC